jgi:Mce-associated membrane protein
MTGRARGLVAVALVAALLAVVVGGVLAGRAWQRDHALIEAEHDAEAAARSAVVAMTTYDHRTIDEDLAWVEEAGTEEFRDYFAAASERTRAFIERARATATGEVVASAADAEDPRHVEVLLFVDQTITAAGRPGEQVEQPRVTMQMVRVDGAWLVEAVDVDNLLPG